MGLKSKILQSYWLKLSLIFISLASFSIFMYLKDIKLQNPPDQLRYEFTELKDEDNIYVDLKNAIESLSQLSDELKSEYYEKETTNDQLTTHELSQLLESEEMNLAPEILTFRKAILQKKSYSSPKPDPINFDMEGLSELRNFYRYESELLKNYVHNQNWQKVSQKINLLSSLYNKAQNINSLVEGLVWVACRGIYISVLHDVISSNNIPNKLLKEIIIDIESCLSWQEIGRLSFAAELNYLKEASKKGFSTTSIDKIMRPNVFYNNAIPYFKYFLSCLYKPKVNIPTPTPIDNLKKQKNDYWYLFRNRETILLAIVIPALDVAKNKFISLGWKEDFVRLRAASLLYKRTHGKLPQEITDLVPEHLTSIPIDMYSGKKVSYNADKALFYVVGPDLKDDRGKQTDSWRASRDNYKGDFKQTIFPEKIEIEQKLDRRVRLRMRERISQEKKISPVQLRTGLKNQLLKTVIQQRVLHLE